MWYQQRILVKNTNYFIINDLCIMGSGVLTLAIGKAGKEKKKFDTFINEIKSRIENTQVSNNAT